MSNFDMFILGTLILKLMLLLLFDVKLFFVKLDMYHKYTFILILSISNFDDIGSLSVEN